ncbi:MAG: helical backbone metal receptor [Anaerolineaceae bacterium]
MAALRIVSLVPSITELVFWLGRGDWLVGRTRFCTEPTELVRKVAIVGGTKNPRIDRIVSIGPDLVLANKEENRREDVEALRASDLKVLLTDPNSIPEAVAMIREIGLLVDAEARAEGLAAEIEAVLRDPDSPSAPRVFVAVWWDPLMGLGRESYGHDLLERAGGINILAGKSRYPRLSLQELADLRPELILLPDEPFPFTAKHVPSFAAVAPTRLIDGRLLWWYGPRIPEALRTLRGIFNESTTT